LSRRKPISNVAAGFDTVCPCPPLTLTFDRLTLKVIYASHLRWEPSFQIWARWAFEFSNYSLCRLRDGRTDGRTDKSNAYCPLPCGRGHNNCVCWLQRLVIAVVSVCGLLLITSLGVMLTVVRRWRRLKHDRDGSEVGVQLDDLVKLLCYTGRRRRRRGTAGRGAKPLDSGRQPTPLADHGELVQLALRSQTVGGGVMEENERYASAADINTRGLSISVSSRPLSTDGCHCL